LGCESADGFPIRPTRIRSMAIWRALSCCPASVATVSASSDHHRPRFRGADRRKTDRAPLIAAGIRRGGQRLALRPNQPSQASSRPTAGVPCARNAMPVTGAPNYGDDAAELGSFPHILIDEEGLGNGGRVGECRSIRTAWNLSLRLSRLPMIRMRSPRTVQQMQPLFISKTSSSALATCRCRTR
jgi:hypothetical protein